jgi:predicted metal-dependent peptidase
MGDIWRGEGKEPWIWNVACDYVNNLVLVASGFSLPEGVLLDNKYKNMSKEEVYNLLIKEAMKKGKDKGRDGQGGQGGLGKPADDGSEQDPCGGFYKPEGGESSPEEQKQQEMEWKTATAQAATLSKGNLPADLRKMIDDELLDPPLPYHVLLRDFLQRTARNDYNWSRPNRRYLSRGIILPGLLSDELPTVVIGNDTSGSCWEYQAQFGKEVSGILGSFQTTTIVVHADARVQKVDEYRTEDLPIDFQVRGGGGTDFRPVFNYVEKEGITPSCLIYLTDLYGSFPNEPPEYPVMWICTNKEVAPFGDTVHMELNP